MDLLIKCLNNFLCVTLFPLRTQYGGGAAPCGTPCRTPRRTWRLRRQPPAGSKPPAEFNPPPKRFWPKTPRRIGRGCGGLPPAELHTAPAVREPESGRLLRNAIPNSKLREYMT